MKVKLQPAMLCMAATLTLGLSACGGSEAPAGDASDAAGKGEQAAAPAAGSNNAGAAAAVPTLAQGPDVCFRAIAKHLGPDAKVSEITSFFSAGSEIDSSDDEPQGQLTTCTVEYQNPEDPRKLLATRMDVDTGSFSPAAPVEIRVSGNAAEFKLDDYIMPIGQIDAAALAGVMEEQKARLSGVYSKYAWTGVRLSAPGPFSDKHTLRLDITGRLASNDIKESGYASVTTDGKKITTDHLMP